MDVTSFILGFKKGAASGGGGGGSVEGVHTVTFMSEDGSTVLYERYVADGDDCANVVDRNLLATPTKESTAQYDYTYSGWSLTSGGSADASALKSVTADRTVYAAFEETARSFTVRFFSFDNVVQTLQATYGEQVTPPTLDAQVGYIHNGWTPNDLTIYGDTDFVAVWEKLTAFTKVSTATSTSTASVQEYAVNNDGTRLVGVLGGSAATAPIMWDLTAQEATTITTGISWPSAYGSAADYSPNGNRLLLGYCIGSGSSSKNVIGVFDITNDTYAKARDIVLNAYAHSNTNRCRFIDNENIYATIYHNTSDYVDYAYEFDVTSGETSWSKKTGKNIGKHGFNETRTKIAASYYVYANSVNTNYLIIASIVDGFTIEQTITTDKRAYSFAFNSDGSRVAAGFSGSVHVYDAASLTKLFEVTTGGTDTHYIDFVRGTNLLVVGSGKVVKVYNVAGDEPEEVENAIMYNGSSSISYVRSNNTGTHVVIGASKYAEVWALS